MVLAEALKRRVVIARTSAQVVSGCGVGAEVRRSMFRVPSYETMLGSNGMTIAW